MDKIQRIGITYRTKSQCAQKEFGIDRQEMLQGYRDGISLDDQTDCQIIECDECKEFFTLSSSDGVTGGSGVHGGFQTLCGDCLEKWYTGAKMRRAESRTGALTLTETESGTYQVVENGEAIAYARKTDSGVEILGLSDECSINEVELEKNLVQRWHGKR